MQIVIVNIYLKKIDYIIKYLKKCQAYKLQDVC